MELEIDSLDLLDPVYPEGTVKLPLAFMERAKLPGICPKCLKPGNITEQFVVSFTYDVGAYQKRVQTISIPISTHSECSQGWQKKNISGTVRIWGEESTSSGFEQMLHMLLTKQLQGYVICFKFSNPVYSLIFSRINFPYLLNERGKRLTSLYDYEFEKRRKNAGKRYSRSCPLCNCYIDSEASICPSCGIDLSGGFDRFERKEFFTEDTEEKFGNIVEVARKCSECGIIMLKQHNVTQCARCGAELG
ncbi:MAG: hypothetical protein KGY80_08630 [Candidatus Thorarchaeota archaeon]|nr:hypothetical protein [Candidatus Thorarchaeota archaeon]